MIALGSIAAASGADGLVLVCAGAGGHTGFLSPFAFVSAVRALDREVTSFAVGHLVDELRARWAGEPAVLGHLGAIQQPVRERGNCDRLDVVRGDEVALGEKRDEPEDGRGLCVDDRLAPTGVGGGVGAGLPRGCRCNDEVGRFFDAVLHDGIGIVVHGRNVTLRKGAVRGFRVAVLVQNSTMMPLGSTM